MRHNYNKLVHDHIPEIIQNSGKRCSVEIMTELEYRQALLEKLVEEALEARQASAEEFVAEIADLQEVIAAILNAWQISPELVRQVQYQRQVERGSF